MTEGRAHAILSASGAYRWLACTPSAKLEEAFPERTSEYAEEGRLAHSIAELYMRKHYLEPMGPKKFAAALKSLQQNPLYQPEMLKHIEAYLDYIAGVVHGFGSPPYIAGEKRLDFSAYVPEGFGTGDCIVIGGEVLHIVDLKYGKGVPVSAERNPQMMLYALGAWLEYSFLYPINRVQMTIFQPRLDTVAEYAMPIADLIAWGDSIKPIAARAFAGEGDFVPGDHCQFCRAKALCRARAEFNTALEEFHLMRPPLISNAEVGDLLARAQNLAAWASDLKEYALAECLRGGEVPGWKAVEGRGSRGTRM